MWISGTPVNIPRTDKPIRITCNNGKLFFVKPGKGFVYEKNSWIPSKQTSILNNKIDRVVISPNGYTSLHLPKHSPLFAMHHNTDNPKLKTLPLPKGTSGQMFQEMVTNGVAPSGDHLMITAPHHNVKDVSYVFNMQNKPVTDFCKLVRGFTCSENGNIFCVSLEDNLWVWQQMPEWPNGTGFWTDLTADQRFGINLRATHPASQHGRVYHGFMKERQTFTLHPALSPKMPSNQAVSYQDLAVFDNPDEGRGLVCLTALMPPCKPFDSIYLFVSICKFNGFKPVFERAETTVTVSEGPGGPCIWWSLCCRVAVVAVCRSIIILTRNLRVIKVIPIEDIFAAKDALVSSVAWSCNGQFFVICSTNGEVSAITRCGKSLKHSLCSLEPFYREKGVPLMSCGDSKNPVLFTIYTRERMRLLSLDLSILPQNLENLMSLHFPFGSVEPMFDMAVDSIVKTGNEKKDGLYNLIKLIFFTDMFGIFPYMSPLRYVLIRIFEDYTERLLDEGNYLMAFWLIRCTFRLTDHVVPVYPIISDRLGNSENRRDQILHMILEDEKNLKDWCRMKKPSDPRITIFDSNSDSDSEDDLDPDYETILVKPDCRRNVKLLPLIQKVKRFLYDDSYTDLSEVEVDLRILMDLMINLGRIDRAIVLARHHSIGSDPYNLYKRICDTYPNDPALIFRAMIYCVNASVNDELEIRAMCMESLLANLKQLVSDSMPTASRPKVLPLSRLAMIEDSLEIIAPSNEKDLDDFVVILSTAFCACDYKYVSMYINGKSKSIPPVILHPLRELFKLVWFIRWRDTAIAETARVRHANDATLRLLAFPEFVKEKAALDQINTVGPRAFSPDAFALYYDGNRDYEDDPAFPSYMAECANRLQPSALSRVQDAVMRIGEKKAMEVPKSRILFATLISHMVPWLRCGIPRALVGFKCGEVIPNELLEFEEFEIKDRPPPKMVIEHIDIAEENPEEEDEDIPVMLPPAPKFDDPISESTDSGEYIPPPREEPVSEISEEPIPKPKRHHHHKKPKPSKKHRSKPKKEIEAPQRSKVKLLSLDPNYVPPRQQYYPPQPQQPYYHQPMNFGPVWDIDFSKFGEKPKKPKEEAPAPQPQEKTKFVFVQSKKQKKMVIEDFSSSGSVSSLNIEPPKRVEAAYADPYPLDEELDRRVNRVLDGFAQNPPPPLRDTPRLYYPDIHTTGVPDREVPRLLVPETVKPKAEESSSEFDADFYPTLQTMRDSKVVGMKGSDTGSSKPTLVLKEIRPSKK